MTDDEIRVKIAEACGWSRIERGTASHVSGFKTWLGSKWGLCGTPPADKDKPEDDQGFEFIPDYLNDLNSMHVAEQSLHPVRRISFLGYLGDLVTNRAIDNSIWPLTHATARQRAEAFIATVCPS